jgi:hypothetical protein
MNQIPESHREIRPIQLDSKAVVFNPWYVYPLGISEDIVVDT